MEEDRSRGRWMRLEIVVQSCIKESFGGKIVAKYGTLGSIRKNEIIFMKRFLLEIGGFDDFDFKFFGLAGEILKDHHEGSRLARRGDPLFL